MYGRTKQLAEAMVGHAACRGQTGYLTARLFNLYGPHPTVEHLIPAVARQALTGDRLVLGNLDSARDYVYVADVADVAVALAELLAGTTTGVVNIGTGIATDGHSIVELTGRLLGRHLTVAQDPARMRSFDHPRLVADPNQLKSLLPRWPATRLAEGLPATLASCVSMSRPGGITPCAHHIARHELVKMP